MDTRTPKLYEEIVSQLMERIQEGTLRPGDRLAPERALAEELGVSRTAIREALRAMEMMGYVESRVGEGTYIRMPSISDIVDPFSAMLAQNRQLGYDLIELRLILETEIAALAARRRTEEQIHELERTLSTMESDLASGGIGLQADEDFHTILASATGNEALSSMLGVCADMLSRTRPVTQSMKGVPAITLSDHAAICDAIRRQDEKAARRLMRAHLKRAMRNLTKIR